MDTLLNLRAFLATVRTGSFSEAARQMNVVPSVIAKRVTHLEWATGWPSSIVPLAEPTVTEAGQRFVAKARELVEDFDSLVMDRPRADALEGHIRVKAPTSLTVLYLGGSSASSNVATNTSRWRWRSSTARSIPLEEGFDIALGAMPASYEGVVDEPLCPLEQMVCASPDYLARRAPQSTRAI